MSIDSPIRREATRRPVALPARPDVSRVTDSVYCVLGIDETMGFVDRVGNVFVAYSGSHLPQAFEVGQSLSWDAAVAMVVRAFNARPGA